MFAALKQSRTNDKFQDPLFLFLELIRAGVLHWNLWGGRAYSGGPSFGDDDEKKCMLLVMRVVSLVPLNTKAGLIFTIRLPSLLICVPAPTMDCPAFEGTFGVQLVPSCPFTLAPHSR
jgi:Temperature dependent protein affecting M2 dsRNA replication